jgi:hypothetical protein
MRPILLFAVLVPLGAAPGRAEDVPPLHTEKALKGSVVVEQSTEPMYFHLKESNKYAAAGWCKLHRLVINDVLHGVQMREMEHHTFDDVMCLFAGRPLETVATVGAVRAYAVRQEPRSYHHREGPIGVIYHELRTRKGGADATAPVAVMGMTAGEQACYALKGQKMTFYEADPAVKRVAADTDKYFSYIADARKRGAEVTVRSGNRRAKLKEDKGAKYALIVVDVAESFPFPTDIFTKEAVSEYFDRLTDDGIVALHTSNKYLFLEPMFAQLAANLKFEARVWNDAVDQARWGRCSCSWLVLARSAKALGSLDAPEPAKTFRRVEVFEGVSAWTDAGVDVTILSNSPAVQAIRRLLGLPTPLDFKNND